MAGFLESSALSAVPGIADKALPPAALADQARAMSAFVRCVR